MPIPTLPVSIKDTASVFLLNKETLLLLELFLNIPPAKESTFEDLNSYPTQLLLVAVENTKYLASAVPLKKDPAVAPALTSNL